MVIKRRLRTVLIFLPFCLVVHLVVTLPPLWGLVLLLAACVVANLAIFKALDPMTNASS